MDVAVTAGSSTAVDIRDYVGVRADDAVKQAGLKYLWSRDKYFEFPVDEKRRLKFQLNWLERFTWLSYSKFQETSGSSL